MPVWIPRDLSEIKPGSFVSMRRLENEYESLRVESLESRAPDDPMFRYIKRLMPKEDVKEEIFKRRKERFSREVERARSSSCRYETSDQGHSLMMDYLKKLPADKVTEVKNDVATLKKDLREVCHQETQAVKSGLLPSSAYRVYAWRDLLEERSPVSKRYSSQPVPSQVFLPDPTQRLVSIYHRDHNTRGKIYNLDGYWQIPKLGPNYYRDKNGLKIINNLEPEKGPDPLLQEEQKEYTFDWPLTDTSHGVSISDYISKRK